MKRLLTDTAIGDLLNLEKEYTYSCSDGSLLTTVDCREVAKAEHTKTLRAVGEWLEKHARIAIEHPSEHVYEATYGFYTVEWWDLLTKLDKGEMPE